MNSQVESHLTNDTLLAYLDGALEGAEVDAARAHLLSCARCSRALEAARNFDALARSVPAERAGSDLVRTIMLRTGITPRQSWLVRSVELLPYAFSLLVVCGVLLAVFMWTGTVSPSTVSGATGVAADAYDALGSAVGEAGRSLGASISRVFPAASTEGLRVAIGVGLILMGIAVLDRFLASRTTQRAR